MKIEGVTMSDVYVIPRAALRAGDHVYLVDDGKSRIQKVRVVRKEEDGVGIESGVIENARIVLSPIPDPVAGMKIDSLDGDAPEVSAR